MSAIASRLGGCFGWALLVGLILTLPAVAAPTPRSQPSPAQRFADPVPGNTLAAYERRYPELHPTGGIAVPRAARGFEFELYDGKPGKELVYSPTFLPADPSDTTGNVYLPKLSVLVLKTPRGDRFVIGESRQVAFEGPEAIDAFLADSEEAARRRVASVSNVIELFKRWYARTVLKEKRYARIFNDEKVSVYQAALDEGKIGSLLLMPDWENASPETYPANIKPGGVLKRIDYLMEYQAIALDDLYPLIRKYLRY
ncbi:MAG TPA: hypothetical protein V6D00_01730 [Pantanalinema sp.]